MSEKQILKQLSNLKEQEKQLRQQLEQVRSRQQFKCQHCGKKSQARKLDVYALYQPWDDPDEPGREAWSFFKYAITCPKCSNLTFARDEPRFDESGYGQWVEQHKVHFNSYTEHRERTGGRIGGVSMYSHDKWKQILHNKDRRAHESRRSIQHYRC